MTRLRIVTYVSVVLAALVFFFERGAPTTIVPGKGLLIDREWLVNPTARITPPEHCRPPDQTFLTYPEWFLVFAPAEQADFFQRQTSTQFPFMDQVGQIWEGYAAVWAQVRGNFPFNTQYHVMILVIASSSTVEFGLKAIYETLIGRLTDTRPEATMTEEDRFNATFAQEYVQFLDAAPWYEFDFKSRLGKLWAQTPWFGPRLLRKWERRYFLTTELAVKTVYGWLIGMGTKTAYETPLVKTAVVINRVPVGVETKVPDLKILKSLPDGSAIVSVPRYAAFTPNVCALASEGVEFREIAGNTSAILVTVLAPRSWTANSEDFKVLFTQPIPTQPATNRIALATPISLLHKTLRHLQANRIAIEHLYDF